MAKDREARFASPAQVAAALAPYADRADLQALLARTMSQSPALGQSAYSSVQNGKSTYRAAGGVAAASGRGRRIVWTTIIGLLFLGGMGWSLGVLIRLEKDGKTKEINVPDGSKVTISENGKVDVKRPKAAASGKAQSPVNPPAFSMDDIDEKIAKLSKEGGTLEDVINTLGEPTEYIWGGGQISPWKGLDAEKDNLPEIYSLRYPKGLSVFMVKGIIIELRNEKPGPGFKYGGLHLGSTLDEVLEVLGQPKETIVGEARVDVGKIFTPGVLYKNINGEEGYCYYGRPDKHIRLFFVNYKVIALFVAPENEGRDNSTDVKPAQAHQSKGSKSADEPHERHFVTIVVGKDKMTFQGEETNWDGLQALLEKVPDRAYGAGIGGSA